MSDQKTLNISIEKVSLERALERYEAIVESNVEWFNNGVLPKLKYSMDELEHLTKGFIEGWENDAIYAFNILDVSNNQIVGFAGLNFIIHQYQIAGLFYQVRTSRIGEGIATEAAKLIVRYGFDELGFQRIELVILKDNVPSQKVAEKLGAVREGLLRKMHTCTHLFQAILKVTTLPKQACTELMDPSISLSFLQYCVWGIFKR